MCGIVGLFLKDRSLSPDLGTMLTDMLVTMTDRGPDSAGIAVYRGADDDRVKFTVQSPEPDTLFPAIEAALAEAGDIDVTRLDTHAIISCRPDQAGLVREQIAALDGLRIMSSGDAIEIYKEVGRPGSVAMRFDIPSLQGSHGIGHTRMATESAVTTAGSHPFSTGPDLCLVHNGSLSNHNRLRERLETHEGIRFRTENDTEVGAAYISHRLASGRSLHQAFEDCIEALDGFYTFVAGTRDGFAVMRDPIACKPAVLAETDDYVAFGSEYRALTTLPGIKEAKVWEPEPATVYSWGGDAQ